MAKEDFVVADRDTSNIEAGDKLVEVDNPDTDAATAAANAGVSSAAFIDYATALAAHESRDDIETLADRRAREAATTYAAADFMRADAYDANGDAVAPPRPGTVHGDAPASS